MILMVTVMALVMAFLLARESHERKRMLAREAQLGRSLESHKKAMIGMAALFGKREKLLHAKFNSPTMEAWKSLAIAMEVLYECIADNDDVGFTNALTEAGKVRRTLQALGEYDA